MGNVDPKMGCKIWTPFWGPPNCFFFSRAPKRGPDFRHHFGVHIARFFSQHDAQKGHPRVGCEQVRLLHKHIAGTVPGHVAITTTNLLTSILSKM